MIESKVYTCPYINHLQNSLSLEVSYKIFVFWQRCLFGLIEVLGKLEVTSLGRNGWVVGSGSRLPHRESRRSAWRHRPINLLKVYVFHAIKRNLNWWVSTPEQEPSRQGEVCRTVWTAAWIETRTVTKVRFLLPSFPRSTWKVIVSGSVLIALFVCGIYITFVYVSEKDITLHRTLLCFCGLC